MSNAVAISGIDFSPEVNLTRYLQRIKKYPVLSYEQEYRLALEYKIYRKAEIATELINSHLRLVVKIVSQYKGYGLPFNEMISEGNMGLLSAVSKFDPFRGFRFSTYAIWWIRAAVQKYILNSWSLVKMGTTAAQKKLFFNLRKIKNKLHIMDDRSMTPKVVDYIAGSLDVSSKEVVDMNARLKGRDGSLNVKVDVNSDDSAELVDFIADSRINQEESMMRSEVLRRRKELFNDSLKCLNEREKSILFKRRLCDKAETLDQLSKVYNISKERVRQIELNSIKKIKRTMERSTFYDSLR